VYGQPLWFPSGRGFLLPCVRARYLKKEGAIEGGEMEALRNGLSAVPEKKKPSHRIELIR